MTTIAKLTVLIITATASVGVVFADDQPVQLQLARQRAQAAPSTTVAVYAGQSGIGNTVAGSRQEVRFTPHLNAHGEVVNLYTAK